MSKKEVIKVTRSKRCKRVEAIKIETGEPITFPSLAEFCAYADCSYTLAYKVVSTLPSNRYYTQAKGYSLMYLDDDQDPT